MNRKPFRPIARPLIGALAALLLGTAACNLVTDWDAKFEREVAREPSMRPLFDAFKSTYPTDYARFKAEAIARAKAGASTAEMNAFAGSWMRSFSRSKAAAVAQAPHAELAAFRESQIAVVRGLRDNSTTQCAHYAMSGLQPGDQPAPALLPVIARQGQLQLLAAGAGTRSPANRNVGTMSQADSVALVRQLQARGVSQADLALIASPAGMMSAPAEKQCAFGVTMLEAVAAMPEAQADRVTGYLVTHQ